MLQACFEKLKEEGKLSLIKLIQPRSYQEIDLSLGLLKLVCALLKNSSVALCKYKRKPVEKSFQIFIEFLFHLLPGLKQLKEFRSVQS